MDNQGETTVYKNPTLQMSKLMDLNKNKILEIKNVFPFDLFQDRVIVSAHKVDLVYGVFFYSDYVVSMLIKDMKNAKVSTGIFFGTLTFELHGYETNPPPVKFLWREDAIKARRVIEGLIACCQNGIDITELDPNNIQEKIEEIGRARVE